MYQFQVTKFIRVFERNSIGEQISTSRMQDRHTERMERLPCRSLSILDALTSDNDPPSANRKTYRLFLGEINLFIIVYYHYRDFGLHVGPRKFW